MGICTSKYIYYSEKFENTDIIKYEGSYIDNKKNGYCIEFSKNQTNLLFFKY